jgi:hypothetical protein
VNEIPTPRTDAISRGYLSVPVEWARTLERELSRALKLAEDNGKLAHQTACELVEARACAEILHRELQKLAIKYTGAGAPALPELPWSQPDLSREALMAKMKGGSES